MALLPHSSIRMIGGDLSSTQTPRSEPPPNTRTKLGLNEGELGENGMVDNKSTRKPFPDDEVTQKKLGVPSSAEYKRVD